MSRKMGTFSRWVKAPPKALEPPTATKPQMYQPELCQGLTIQSKPCHSMTGRPWPSIDGLVLVMVITMMMMLARAH